MGLDGFSMGVLGLNTDLTSAQMAEQAEQLANKEFEVKIKDIEQLAEQQLIKRKEENSNNNRQSKDDSKKKKQNENEEDELSGLVTEKDFENKDPKEFSVRINPENELIELFNNREQRIVETISASDLMNLISRLDSASGILINRKI